MRLYIVLSLLVVCSVPAQAYIDAGSGSYMLQMALAGLMAVVFSIKLSWQRIKRFASGLISGRARAGSGGQA
jgi:hypothetical protein